MSEQWPYNLPIWRRSFSSTSPDGKLTASIERAYEISMSNPTMGTLVFSTGLRIDRCNPSFIWSDDSKYLAVPQYSTNWFFGVWKQRLLVVDPINWKGWLSEKMAYYILPETFCDGQIAVTLEPTKKKTPRLVTLSEVLETFTEKQFPNHSPEVIASKTRQKPQR